MKVVIIEDEVSASGRLKRHLQNIDSTIEILAFLESVEEAIEWLGNNNEPDLIFMDIQLSDGLSFEIFDEIKIKCPVIFTTAYNEYAIKAFKVNSIDYLLKPIDPKELEASLNKFNQLNARKTSDLNNEIKPLLEALNIKNSAYKSRFLIKKSKALIVLPVDTISFFCIVNQLVYASTKNGNKYMLDYTLEEIEEMINPEHFFRINRQMIIAVDAIVTISDYFNNRLILTLKPLPEGEVIVSREKVTEFKKWLDR